MAKSIWDREESYSLLEVYDIETGERKVLKEYEDLIEAPNWSKDGKYLYYNSKGKIFSYNLETGEDKEIYSDFVYNCNNDHVLSPDGKSIAVSHGTKEDGLSRVYIFPLEGGIPSLITPLGMSFLHGWSPDGSTLAYCAFREFKDGTYNSMDVYTIPVTGGVETRLTTAEGLDDGPEYDPTGEYIWFNSVRSGLMQVWRMKKDGSEQTQMTFDQNWNTWFPHISPDGEKVVTIAYKKGDLEPGQHLPDKNVELRLMNCDGSDVKTVVKLFGGQGTINVNSWSPCSKKFAFISYRLK